MLMSLGLFTRAAVVPPPEPGPGGGEINPDLPLLGLYYGGAGCGGGAANTHLKASSDDAVSYFFVAERDGKIDRMFWQPRMEQGYSGGTGGVYTIEIRAADAGTRRASRARGAGGVVSRITGYKPGNPARSTEWKHLAFTETPGATVAGRPYCITWRNTHPQPNTNYISSNVSNQQLFEGGGSASAGSPRPPANYQEPKGTPPSKLKDKPGPIQGFMPMILPDGQVFFPREAKTVDGRVQYNRLGDEHLCLHYAPPPQWTGWGFAGGQGEPMNRVTIDGVNQFRQRFRVSRADRRVDGLMIRLARIKATKGALVARLERGPQVDDHFAGNGSEVATVEVGHADIYDAGKGICSIENVCGADMNFTPYLWIPFPEPVTLKAGTVYNARFHTTGGLACEMIASSRPDRQGLGPMGRDVATWDQWEARREVPWGAWEDSRGLQKSPDGGRTWAYHDGAGQDIPPLIFRMAGA